MADSLKGATKKAIYQSKVDSLDSLGTSAEEFLQANSLTVIENKLGDFIERVHKNINDTPGMVTTGKINELSIQGVEGAVNLIGNKWLIYQDRGVNGSVISRFSTPHKYTNKMPPVGVFKQWIKDKNIRLINNDKYTGEKSPFHELTEDEQIDKAAWGMASKVYREGFKARDIFGKEIPKLVEDLAAEVANIGVQSILQLFDIKESAKRVIT